MTHLTGRFLFVFLTVFALSDGFGQTRYFRNYSVEHGLAFVNVSTMYQDSKGYLWCGGYGGVSRFDGFTFQNYGPRDGLANNFVKSIVQDSEGKIWFGTFKGLSRYHNNRFENFYKENGLAGNDINRLFIDSRNILWVCTKEGLSCKKGRDFETIPAKELYGKNITGIVQDKYGNYILSCDSNLFFAELSAGVFRLLKTIRIATEITYLYCDQSNNIWIGGKDGLYLYAGDEVKALRTGIEVRDIIEASGRIVWVGTATGLIRYKEDASEELRIGKDINSNLISCLLIDREQNLWIGSYSGLFRYRGDTFETYTEEDGLNNTFIYQILRDLKGDLWVATANGAYRYNGKSFKAFHIKDGLPSNEVSAIIQDKKGNIWFGTSKGLAVYDGKSFRSYTKEDGQAIQAIIALYLDSKDRLWIGGRAGICLLQEDRFKYFPLDTVHREFDISAFAEDKQGHIWAGAYQGGFYRYKDGAFEDMASVLNIRSNAYMALTVDDNGVLYIGTFDGVFIYDGKRVMKVSEKEGLSSDLVYCMTLDRNKEHLWIGTNQGVNRLHLPAYKKGEVKLRTFNKKDGFLGVECNTNGAYLDRDASIWFGTVNGLIRYKPTQYFENTVEPQTNLTGIQLFDRDTVLPLNTSLPYWQNSISFEFVGISLTHPERVRYRYILQGFNSQWIEERRQNLVSYSNLPPGKYRFMLVSCNNDGVWNKNPVAFSFSILTPFWKTNWFRFSMLGLLVVSVISGLKLRTRQIRKKERRALQQKIHIMEYQLKALRAQMNPHFIFNSLNSIQNFIINSNEDAANKYLNKFAKLMRLILNNSESATVTVREELEALELYLQLERMRFESKFDYRIDVSPKIDQDFYEIPSMLLQPYVENAIIHGLNPKKEKGELTIRLDMDEHYLVCTVEDNGIGRKKAGELRQSSSHHKSVGMKITQERLQMLNAVHNSNLSVTITDLVSSDGREAGTRVQIFIPIK